ncbi:MAG TPA: cupin domain-containing protein [Gammaproteobacteria bacterium]|nr:cupin domain-containing protein [Gammaproteobacteria bacterium]
MQRRRWLLLAAVVGGIAVVALPSAFAEKDAQGFVITKPDELKYEPNETGSGPDIAVVYGDPTKPGLYIIRARFKPGVMSKPHYHPTDRHVTVISGTWWAGRDASGDPNKTTPLGPGSYMLHPAGKVHYDGAKEVEAVVEIKGIGPAPTVSVGQ